MQISLIFSGVQLRKSLFVSQSPSLFCAVSLHWGEGVGMIVFADPVKTISTFDTSWSSRVSGFQTDCTFP